VRLDKPMPYTYGFVRANADGPEDARIAYN
jgi:hypothetical protein